MRHGCGVMHKEEEGLSMPLRNRLRLAPILALPLILVACSSQSNPMLPQAIPCPVCQPQRPPVTVPPICEAAPILAPEPPAPDDLPEPPAAYMTAPEEVRVWVQTLTALVVQYALQERERADVATIRLDAACDGIAAQQ